MKVISGKNSSGKTKELIKYSLETGIPIYATSQRVKESLQKKSEAYFGELVKVILPTDSDVETYTEVLIDDIDKVCNQLLCNYYPFSLPNLKIVGATLTED